MLALLAALLAPATPAPAADPDGRFAVKGVGTTDCRRYLAARAQGGDEYLLYGGYIGGYVTAYNELHADNFDLLPWHTVDTVTGMLERYCERHPAVPFGAALSALANLLKEQRIRRASPPVSVRNAEQSVVLYRQALREAQARLAALGLLQGEPSGQADTATIEALVRFQQANGLPATGVPDQRTLLLLHHGRDGPGG